MASQFPTLEPGVTYLDDGGTPAALYRLVGDHLADVSGSTYWVDARNAASPEALRQQVSRRARRALHVARAFTGFQHYELVRELPARVSSRTALIVAPNLASLYAEDDVPEHEAEAMFEATLELLAGVAQAVEAPVVVTAGTWTDRVRAAADRTLEANRTRAGLRVDGETFQTDVYRDGWGFQTTIPYWVDLVGAVEDAPDPAAVDPVALGV